jgi:hypothetical protein
MPAPPSLPPQLTVARERPSRLRPSAWPPRITPRRVNAGFERLPHRIGVCERAALVRGLEVPVFVVFGRPHPTATQAAEATAVLRALKLP